MERSSTHVVFYNIWGHRLPELLEDYFTANKDGVDIFCLTEVTHMGKPYDPVPAVYTSLSPDEPPSAINGYDQISALLQQDYALRYKAVKFEPWTCERTQAVFEDVGFGSTLVYKKDLNIIAEGHSLVQFNNPDAGDRILQWMIYDKDDYRYLVAHLHGVWLRENTKGDDPVRDMQSIQVAETLSEIVRTFKTKKIVFGGDLNLAIDTRALLALEYDSAGKQQLINLVRERGIQNTRTPRYRKFHLSHEPMHADYAFVSPNVEVLDF